MFDAYRQWRARRSAAREARLVDAFAIPEPLWDATLARFAFVRWLDVASLQRLRRLVSLFLADKQFTMVQGLEPDDAIFAAIAVQACLPILELDLSLYGGWREIVVYPGEFVIRKTVQDEAGVVHEVVQDASGEAWHGGPVILSWQDAGDDSGFAYNVVIHEFAHKIDMRNGVADGMPPLSDAWHRGIDRPAWRAGLQACFDAFCAAVAAVPRRAWRRFEAESLLDPYAAQDPAEFFAVASETFFVAPRALADEMPPLYDLLRAYYRQDPAQWERDADAAAVK
ncbi:M90 family metallopeptidase [Chitinasiproducens palmae]|uniref:Zinc-dependent peptidase n=1 Tax=Chitinasiproducens palmae TaxID=1770053 RepID=A0A1H2PLY1_9BURK|nr:M90 family metallopeptidase [Chitinasiproducens palmae]SDV47564.1 hypothetical protein SAMN05216551_103104 [Chitinasiproducens palmae]